MSYTHNTCNGDSGWMVILDQLADTCSWADTVPGPTPKLMYCPQTTYCLWAGENGSDTCSYKHRD